MSLEWNTQTLLTSLVAFLAMMLWLINRVKTQKVWLPILRVLNLKRARLRKLMVKKPPLLAFLLFILSCALMIFLTLKPQKIIAFSSDKNEQKIHIFLDMSTSITAEQNIEEYLSSLEDIWKSFPNEVVVSVSSSHSRKVQRVSGFSDLKIYVKELGFHRAGIYIANAIEAQKKEFQKAQTLIIVSDGAHSSWRNFNWEYFDNRIKVFFYNISKTKPKTSDNIFINEINQISVSSDPVLSWDVNIERTNVNFTRDGSISVIFGKSVLAEQYWNFSQGQKKSLLRISVVRSTLAKNNKKPRPFKFVISPSQDDSVRLDNNFFVPMHDPLRDVLLVASPAGEREIEDPFYQLTAAFEVSGFTSKRWDGFAMEQIPKDYPFVVASIGENYRGNLSQCPKKILNSSKDQHIWLVPQLFNNTYRQLCSCFMKLTRKSEQSVLCQSAKGRQGVANLFERLGFSRLGGDIRYSEESLAWFSKFGSKTVTAFMIPLSPNKKIGLDHAVFPLMVNEMLVLDGLLPKNLIGKHKNNGWNRVVDLSKEAGWKDGAYNEMILTSNVPREESLLNFKDSKDLPQVWEVYKDNKIAGQFLESKKDPLPWILLCLILLVTFMFFEGVYNNRIKKTSAMYKNIIIFVFMIFSTFFSAKRVNASVSIVLYEDQKASVSYEHLSRIVSNRTSLEMNSKVIQSKDINFLTNQAWIWTTSERILDKKRRLKASLVYWIKRGGFMVIQNANIRQLDQLTVDWPSVKNSRGGKINRSPKWVAISPDHELMRSFYLLESLPMCDENLWYGLQFDGRIAAIAIPFDLLNSMNAKYESQVCGKTIKWEQRVRIFINILMVVLTTDYKKDQIHMKSILKRLR